MSTALCNDHVVVFVYVSQPYVIDRWLEDGDVIFFDDEAKLPNESLTVCVCVCTHELHTQLTVLELHRCPPMQEL